MELNKSAILFPPSGTPPINYGSTFFAMVKIAFNILFFLVDFSFTIGALHFFTFPLPYVLLNNLYSMGS